MKRLFRCLMSLPILAFQTACYTMAHVQLIPVSEGKARTFPGDVDHVAAAARKALVADELHLAKEERTTEGRWILLAQKYPSLNDYGSIVRILIEPDTGSRSLVRVVTRLRAPLNITGVRDFSPSFFEQLDRTLVVAPPGALTLAPGTAIRARFADGRVTQGILRASSADSIALGHDSISPPTSFALTSVSGVDRALNLTERRRATQRAMMLGTVFGTVAGGALGAIMPVKSGCGSTTNCLDLSGIEQAANMLAGSVVGGLLGLAIGHSVGNDATGWVPVPLAARVSVTSGEAGGAAVRFRAAF